MTCSTSLELRITRISSATTTASSMSWVMKIKVKPTSFWRSMISSTIFFRSGRSKPFVASSKIKHSGSASQRSCYRNTLLLTTGQFRRKPCIVGHRKIYKVSAILRHRFFRRALSHTKKADPRFLNGFFLQTSLDPMPSGILLDNLHSLKMFLPGFIAPAI